METKKPRFEPAVTGHIPSWMVSMNKDQFIQFMKDGNDSVKIMLEAAVGNERCFFLHHLESKTMHKTHFVQCCTCLSVLTKNGGQVSRHRAICMGNNSNNPRPPTSKTQISASMATLFATSTRPVNEVDELPFRTFCAEMLEHGKYMDGINAADLIPSRRTVTRYMESTIEECIGQLKVLTLPVFNSDFASYIGDFGKIREDFLALKASFLIEKTANDGKRMWEMCIVPLGFRAVPVDTKKTADQIYQWISESVEKFSGTQMDLSRAYFTADGAKNVRRCGKDHFSRYVRCSAHLVAVLAKRVLEPYKTTKVDSSEKVILSEYSKILSLSRSVSQSVKKDKKMYSDLDIVLTVGVETRWFSDYTCLKNLYESIDKIGSVSYSLTDECQEHVKELINVDSRKHYAELSKLFEPLFDMSKHFQKNASTIHEVPVLLLSFLEKLDEFESEDSDDLNILIKFARIATQHLFGELEDIHFAASYLTPCWRDLISLEQRVRDCKMDIPVVTLVGTFLEDVDLELNPAAARRTSTPAKVSTETNFVRQVLSSPKVTNSAMSLWEERILYEQDVHVEDPLTYWPSMSHRLPRLSRIARKVFGVLSSEADSERTFSIAKHVYTKNRQTMGLDLLEKLMLVKESQQYL